VQDLEVPLTDFRHRGAIDEIVDLSQLDPPTLTQALLEAGRPVRFLSR
jgi:hypothetical protein